MQADVVVIGGGVLGLCSAIAIAQRGLSVILCEQQQLGWGQSGRSLAVISQHYADPAWVALAVAGLRVFQHFDDHYGGSCGYVPSGLLLLSNSDTQPLVAMQQGAGAKVAPCDTAAQRALDPAIRPAPYGTWQPDAGYVDCWQTLATLQAAATDLVLREQTLITRIVATDSQIQGVMTHQGEQIECGIVIQAAGAWSAPLAASVGVALPLIPCAQRMLSLRRPQPHPGYILNDFCLGFSARSTAWGTDLGWFDRRQTNDPVTDLEAPLTIGGHHLSDLWQVWQQRYPHDRAQIWGSWGGIYDVSPDWLPIVDQVGPEGYYLCCGTSGHGFKFGPVLAQLLADWVEGHSSRLPHLAWERFYL